MFAHMSFISVFFYWMLRFEVVISIEQCCGAASSASMLADPLASISGMRSLLKRARSASCRAMLARTCRLPRKCSVVFLKAELICWLRVRSFSARTFEEKCFVPLALSPCVRSSMSGSSILCPSACNFSPASALSRLRWNSLILIWRRVWCEFDAALRIPYDLREVSCRVRASRGSGKLQLSPLSRQGLCHAAVFVYSCAIGELNWKNEGPVLLLLSISEKG